MLTVGKLIDQLKKFDKDTLIDIDFSSSLGEEFVSSYDGIGFCFSPKLNLYERRNKSSEKKINLVLDYFCYDDISEEELEEKCGPNDFYDFIKEIDIE